MSIPRAQQQSHSDPVDFPLIIDIVGDRPVGTGGGTLDKENNQILISSRCLQIYVSCKTVALYDHLLELKVH